MGWDEDNDKFIFGTTTAAGDSFKIFLLTYQTVKASTFEGALSGNVTGDVTGNADTATKIASITNSNIVQLSSTQTLTNKTLTSPVLTAPALGTPASGNLAN